MAQRISTVSGVAQVQVYGSQKYAVRVKLDPMAISSKAIGIDEVADAIDSGNVNLPTGILYGSHRAFTVLASGQLNTAEAYRPLIVAYRNGSPVRLDDIAELSTASKTTKWLHGTLTATAQQRSIVLAVQRQPGTNTVEVADAVKKLLPTFRGQLPASVTVHILYDRSLSIKDSVRDVEFTLLITLVPGCAGYICVSSQCLCHIDTKSCTADGDCRDLCSDVPVRIQSRQSVADGADAFGRIRRG